MMQFSIGHLHRFLSNDELQGLVAQVGKDFQQSLDRLFVKDRSRLKESTGARQAIRTLRTLEGYAEALRYALSKHLESLERHDN